MNIRNLLWLTATLLLVACGPTDDSSNADTNAATNGTPNGDTNNAKNADTNNATSNASTNSSTTGKTNNATSNAATNNQTGGTNAATNAGTSGTNNGTTVDPGDCTADETFAENECVQCAADGGCDEVKRSCQPNCSGPDDCTVEGEICGGEGYCTKVCF